MKHAMIALSAVLALTNGAKEFRKLVVGKSSSTLDGEAMVMSQPDGTITGNASGQPIGGTWYWSKGKLCSAVIIANKARPGTCKTVAISGQRLLVRSDQGDDVFYDLR